VGSSGLEEIVLCCKNCASLISLTGFSKIQKIDSQLNKIKK
jgi:hypothetical protein